jgi:hypothetical protein
MGGGVFELSFPDKDNLFKIDFESAIVSSVYGANNQFIQAVWQGPGAAVPEPGYFVPLGIGLGAVLLARHVRIVHARK